MADGPLQRGRVALQREQPRLLVNALVEEGLRGGQFFLDVAELLLGGAALDVVARNLVLVLLDAFFQGLELLAQCVAAGPEQVLLGGHQRCGVPVAGHLEELPGKRDGVGSVPLRDEPCLPRPQALVAGVEPLEPGAGLGVVEPREDLPGLDVRAVFHQDLAQDAALQVLDRLVAPGELDLAGDHHGHLQGDECRPGPEATDHEDQDQQAHRDDGAVLVSDGSGISRDVGGGAGGFSGVDRSRRAGHGRSGYGQGLPAFAGRRLGVDGLGGRAFLPQGRLGIGAGEGDCLHPLVRRR